MTLKEIFFTKKMFEQIDKGKFESFISEIVVNEINNCPDSVKRKKMLGLMKKFNIKMLSLKSYQEEVEQLSNKYILAGAIPLAKNWMRFILLWLHLVKWIF